MTETAMHTNGAMPPKVAAAVAGVMAKVPKLKKGEKNSHGNYNFASIDDFLEAVRPLCAEEGLIILQDEESVDTREGRDKNGNTIVWLVMRFRFTLAHASGETWGERPTRTIMVNASMGSQAFGAAQSYALKQYMRSLFQIATGEKGQDADEHPHADLPATRKTAKETRDEWKDRRLGKVAWTAELGAFVRDLEACSDSEQLAALLQTEEAQRLIRECREWALSWYEGKDDVEGLGPRIARLQTELANRGDAWEPEKELTPLDAG